MTRSLLFIVFHKALLIFQIVTLTDIHTDIDTHVYINTRKCSQRKRDVYAELQGGLTSTYLYLMII